MKRKKIKLLRKILYMKPNSIKNGKNGKNGKEFENQICEIFNPYFIYQVETSVS